MDETRLQRIIRDQDGVITREQVLRCGGTDEWIEAQLAARRWQHMHRKVFLTVTGVPTQLQRQRAALLCAGPHAALSHHTAAARWGGPAAPNDRVHLTVPYGKSADEHPGVVIHRSRAFARIVVDRSDLPTVSAADTCVDLAVAREDPRDAMRTLLHTALAMGVGADRVREVMDRRRPRRYRAVLRAAVLLLADGVGSVLEGRYTLDVEDAHGLPRGRRQAPVPVEGSARYEDCIYDVDGEEVVVRLDGWRYHSDRRAARIDRARDNAAELAGRGRLVFGWEEVSGGACRVASDVAQALHARGWTGALRSCGPGCTVRVAS